jgi:SAM-dependent methyltransferase
MHLDVISLREFYSRPLGAVTRLLIGKHIRRAWPNVRGMSVFGLGYATPYLAIFRGEAVRVGALMPADQGVVAWPELGPMQTALVHEQRLPLPDASVDRILIVHNLETTDGVRALLREVWRVLAPEGKMLLVVPNRRSVWALLEATPFGHGRPFSRGQLASLLRDAMFTPLEWMHVLHLLPINWSLALRWSNIWEKFGAVLWPAFSGVILVEASKQIYAAAPSYGVEMARGRLSPVPSGCDVEMRGGSEFSETVETPPARQPGSVGKVVPKSPASDPSR